MVVGSTPTWGSTPDLHVSPLLAFIFGLFGVQSQQIVSSKAREHVPDPRVLVVASIMGVAVQSGSHLLVTHQPPHDVDRHTIGDEPGCVAVPKVMESQPRRRARAHHGRDPHLTAEV